MGLETFEVSIINGFGFANEDDEVNESWFERELGETGVRSDRLLTSECELIHAELFES